VQSKSSSVAATILLGTLLVAGEVAANPAGVPLAGGESPPLSCTTANFTIQMSAGFPAPASCNEGPCTEYRYNISSPTLQNVDHAVFAVSATQNLSYSTVTNGVVYVTPPGPGDNATGFLAGAQHEYPIRFNSNNNKSELAQIFIVGPSRPKIGTVLIRSGSKLLESCLIATPGIAADPFQPIFQSQTALVAGGKCQVNLTFDASGNVVDVNPAAGSTCIKYEGPVTVTIGNNVGPLRNNTSPHGLTFGNGTTTCYGPPVPSVPKCICTAAPCP